MRYGDYLRLSHETKQPFYELMGWSGPMTQRQFVVQAMWLKLEWDRPNRTDWYLMQVAAEVTALLHAQLHVSLDSIKVANYKLKFNTKIETGEEEEISDEATEKFAMLLSQSAAMDRHVKEDGTRSGVFTPAPVVPEGEEYIEEQPDFSNWAEQ